MEFREKVNFGEEKVIRATSLASKLIIKSFNFEKLAKTRGKTFPQASNVVNIRILETVLFSQKSM